VVVAGSGRSTIVSAEKQTSKRGGWTWLEDRTATFASLDTLAAFTQCAAARAASAFATVIGTMGGTLCLTSDALRGRVARQKKLHATVTPTAGGAMALPALVRGERSNSKGLLDQSKRPAAWASMV
jgi:hypothetical protein